MVSVDRAGSVFDNCEQPRASVGNPGQVTEGPSWGRGGKGLAWGWDKEFCCQRSTQAHAWRPDGTDGPRASACPAEASTPSHLHKALEASEDASP